jgi:hypothetical protein
VRASFKVDRFNAPTTAAITVDGAKSVILSGLTISNTPAVTISYAINLINKAEATITRGRIDAGAGSVESIGVRSVGSLVHIQNNCAGINGSGRCDEFLRRKPLDPRSHDRPRHGRHACRAAPGLARIEHRDERARRERG